MISYSSIFLYALLFGNAFSQTPENNEGNIIGIQYYYFMKKALYIYIYISYINMHCTS